MTTGRLIPFDRTGPDPTHRPEAHSLLFSERCGTNAIETGLRILADRPLYPRKLFDARTERCIWVSQETCRQVEPPC